MNKRVNIKIKMLSKSIRIVGVKNLNMVINVNKGCEKTYSRLRGCKNENKLGTNIMENEMGKEEKKVEKVESGVIESGVIECDDEYIRKIIRNGGL